MLSRIADSLFWLNRYMERTDGLVRLVRIHYILSLDRPDQGSSIWEPVLDIFSPPGAEGRGLSRGEIRDNVQYLFDEAGNPNSIRTLVQRARENARGAQDYITKELWEQVNQLYHLVNQPGNSERIGANQILPLLDLLSEQLLLYQGTADCTMPRNMGWSFLNAGKFLERGLLTLEITQRQYSRIGYSLESQQDVTYWKPLLLSLSGFEHYLKTYSNPGHNRNVLDLVLFNQEFTRSARFCLERLKEEIGRLLAENHPADSERLEKCFGRVYSRLAYSDLEQVSRESVPLFFGVFKKELLDCFHLFYRIFFSYS